MYGAENELFWIADFRHIWSEKWFAKPVLLFCVFQGQSVLLKIFTEVQDVLQRDGYDLLGSYWV